MTRGKLFYLRAAGSVAALALLFLVVRGLWFPSGYFQIFGVAKLFLMMAVGALVIGPVLSAVVFRPGKKGLRFDLTALAVLELGAICWGIYEIAERRPVYAVFSVDRFEAVAAQEIDLTQIRDSELATWPTAGPRLVYAELPTDPEVMSRLIDETVLDGKADIDRRPEFWKAYPRGMPQLKQALLPLEALVARQDARAEVVTRWLQGQALAVNQLGYLPIRGRGSDGTIIVHAEIGYPIEILAVDPW